MRRHSKIVVWLASVSALAVALSPSVGELTGANGGYAFAGDLDGENASGSNGGNGGGYLAGGSSGIDKGGAGDGGGGTGDVSGTGGGGGGSGGSFSTHGATALGGGGGSGNGNGINGGGGGSLSGAAGNGGNGGNGGYFGGAGGGGGYGIRLGTGTSGSILFNANGGGGGSGTLVGGGGGGGSGVRADDSSTLAIEGAATVTGGAGGNGTGGGGGGGSGVLAANATINIAGSVIGGRGGRGAIGLGAGGAGVRASNSTITISGAVTGGNGGRTGQGGGQGIVGSGLTVVLQGDARIAGGTDDFSLTQAAAIAFTGGTNVLELRAGPGGQMPVLTGGITHASISDTLRLGGGNNGALAGLGSYAGFGLLEKTGNSTWTLTGASAVSTARVNGGKLGVAAGGTVVSSGTTILGTVNGASGELLVTGAGSVWTSRSSLSVGNVGSGTLTVTAGGTMRASTFSALGNLTGSNGTGIVTGAGSTWTSIDDIYLGAFGTGTLTVAAGGTVATGYGAGTIRVGVAGGSAGTLIIGSAAGQAAVAAGTVAAGTVQFGAGTGRLVFNHTGNPDGSDYGFAPVIAGAGTVEQRAGVTVLTGANAGLNSFTGTANVTGGRLAVNGTFGDLDAAGGLNQARVNVSNAGVLGGTGTIAGRVTIGSGGTLSAGNSPGTLTIAGDVTLGAGARALFELGAPNAVGTAANDLVRVGGALAVDAGSTLALRTTAGGRVASGFYTLFDVSGITTGRFGTVTNGGAVATTDVRQIVTGGGAAPSQFQALVANGGQVVQFWDGTGAPNDGAIGGGAGTWSGAASNWTTLGGTLNSSWQDGVGVFTGSGGGTVTVAGTQSVQGLQFSTSGYTLTGGGLTLSGNPFAGSNGRSFVTVDTGVATTIGSTLSGAGGLAKLGAGTLTLTGANTYTGGTEIAGGTLVIGADPQLGERSGALAFSDGTLRTTASFASAREVTLARNGTVDVAGGTQLDLSGGVRGAGALVKGGGGTLRLTGGLAADGGSDVRDGRLVLDGGTVRVRSAFGVSTGSATARIEATNVDASGNQLVFSALQGGSVSLTGGTVRADGAGATTVYAQAGRATVQNASLGASGNNAYGARVDDAGTLAITSSRVVTAGQGGVGVVGYQYLTDRPFNLALDRTTVETNGANAHGLLLRNDRVVVAPSGPAADSTATVSASSVTTRGDGAAGAYVRETRLRLEESAIASQRSDALRIARGGAIDMSGGRLSSGRASAAIGLSDGRDASLTLRDRAEATANDGTFVAIDRAAAASGPAASGSVAIVLDTGATASGVITDNAPTAGSSELTLGRDARFGGAVLGLDRVTLSGGTWTMIGQQDFAALRVGPAGGTLASSGDMTIGAAISGTGTLRLSGTGTARLGADSSGFAGTTELASGRLRLDTGLGGDVNVLGGGLSGTGTIGGNLSVAGGTLAGRSGETLSVGGDLTLASSSTVDVSLGGVSSAALFAVGRDLTLDGTLTVSDAGGFGAGVYRLFGYGGRLTDNGLDIASVPGGVAAGDLAVQTAIAGRVNLVASGGADLGFWDGGDTRLHDNGAVDGGSGLWRVDGRNWTDLGGAANGPFRPNPRFAVFEGTGGTVQVDDGAGAIGVTGMQFAASGYRIEGDAVALRGAGGATVIRVGDGSAAGAATTATLAAALTGASSLVKDDRGTLVLTGANTYTGGTQVRAGTLVGDAGSIRGDIANAGAVVFDQTADASFAGTIGGLNGTAGAMVKRGAGTLTLSGASTLDWTVEAGGLASATERFGGDLDLRSGTIFTFDQSTAGTYAGAISGAGELAFTGGGTVRLTGDGSGYRGVTQVTNATLSVNDRLGGSALIGDGGRLGGTGTLGSGAGSTVTIASGGTLAPGNSPGTLTVDGDLAMQAGSRYEVEVVPGAATGDLVTVTGTATLGGTLAHVGLAGAYDPAATYTILTAGKGVTGRFAGVSSSFAFLDPTLAYTSDAVTLSLARNDTGFADVGQTRNQRAAAAALDGLGAGNALHDKIVRLDAATARTAFDGLSGEIHASVATGLIEDGRALRDAATARIRAAFGDAGASQAPVTAYGPDGPVLASPAADLGLAVWSTAYGSWGESDGNGNAAALDRDTGGVLVGADAALFDTWRLGLFGGTSHSSVDADARASAASVDSTHLGLYGGTRWNALSFRSGLAYSWHDIDTHRSVGFASFGDSLSGSDDAGTFQAFGEIGTAVDTSVARLEPFANLAYVNLHTDGFAEQGGAAALAVHGDTTETTFTTLGLRGERAVGLGAAQGRLTGTAGWRHAFGDTVPTTTNAFAGSQAFTVAGAPIAQDALVLDAGLELDLTPNATLGLSYQGQIAKSAQDNGLKANLGIRF